MKLFSFSLGTFCVSEEPKKENGKTSYDGLCKFMSVKIMGFPAVQLFLRAIVFQEIEWFLHQSSEPKWRKCNRVQKAYYH